MSSVFPCQVAPAGALSVQWILCSELELGRCRYFRLSRYRYRYFFPSIIISYVLKNRDPSFLSLSATYTCVTNYVDQQTLNVTEARWRLRSASSTSLDVRRTRLSTVGDRAFPVTAACLWNSLPSHVTAAPPLSPSSAVVLNHNLFSLSYPAFFGSSVLKLEVEG